MKPLMDKYNGDYIIIYISLYKIRLSQLMRTYAATITICSIFFTSEFIILFLALESCPTQI